MGEKFEYLVEDMFNVKNECILTDRLNELGKHRWELVSVILKDDDKIRLFLKRSI